MPGPIERIGAKVIAPQSEVKSGGPSRFKEIQKNAMPKDPGVKTAAAADPLPPMKEVTAAEQKKIERDLRKRIEHKDTQDPTKLLGGDLKDLRKQLDGVAGRIEAAGKKDAPSGVRDRLAAIEEQFTASEARLQNIPKGDNLRDLLSLQTEMYKMSQNIEILTKVVDSAAQGVKQTLQTQV